MFNYVSNLFINRIQKKKYLLMKFFIECFNEIPIIV